MRSPARSPSSTTPSAPSPPTAAARGSSPSVGLSSRPGTFTGAHRRALPRRRRRRAALPTGDLARWDGGELRLVGRDRQVQLRGLRLELARSRACSAAARSAPRRRHRRRPRTLGGHRARRRRPRRRRRRRRWRRRRAAECGDELAAAAVALVAAHVRRWLPPPARGASRLRRPRRRRESSTARLCSRRCAAAGERRRRHRGVRAPADALERKVAATWAEVLGASPRGDAARRLCAAGGDSIKALQLARTLSVQLVRHEKGPPRAGPTQGPPEGTALPGMPQNNAASRAVAHAAAAGAEAADTAYPWRLLDRVLRRCSTGTLPSYARGGGGGGGGGGRGDDDRRLPTLRAAAGVVVGGGAAAAVGGGVGRGVGGAAPPPRPRPRRRHGGGAVVGPHSPSVPIRRRGQRGCSRARAAASPTARSPRPPRGRTRRPHAPRRAAARRARLAYSSGGVPPLHLAAEQPAALDALDALLGGGAPLAMRDGRRQTALHSAARAGNVDAIGRLLAAAAADPPGRSARPAAPRALIELGRNRGIRWGLIGGERRRRRRRRNGRGWARAILDRALKAACSLRRRSVQQRGCRRACCALVHPRRRAPTRRRRPVRLDVARRLRRLLERRQPTRRCCSPRGDGRQQSNLVRRRK